MLNSTLRALILLSLALPAAAQDDLDDKDFYFRHYTVGGGNNRGSRAIDAAYTAEGKLLMAFAEDHVNQPDHLLIVEHDLAKGTYTRMLDRHVMMDDIEEIALVVPPENTGSSNRDRWYVVASASNQSKGAGSPPDHWLMLISGRLGVKNDMRLCFQNGLEPLTNHVSEVQPTIALTPNAGSWTDDSVEIAFAWSDAKIPTRSIYRATSTDYGNWLSDLERVAGPGGTALDVNTACLNPSLAGDATNRTTVLAFEDTAGAVVHVAAAYPGSDMRIVWSTPSGGAPEHDPRIAANDAELNLVFRSGVPSPEGMAELHWMHGDVHGGNFLLPTLSQRAITTGEIMLRDGEAYVAALTLPDAGLDPVVTAFEADWTDVLTPVIGIRVSDGLKPAGVPHVFVTPEGVDPEFASYAWWLPGNKPGWLDTANADY